MRPNPARWSVTPAAILAHQGGWDEILLIVGPMAGIAWLLVVAKRRVDAAAESAGRDSAKADSRDAR